MILPELLCILQISARQVPLRAGGHGEGWWDFSHGFHEKVKVLIK